VFAIKGETLGDYWDYVVKIFDWGQDTTCNLIPDGGDAMMFALWARG
jgi:adenosylhomocysteinase